jgi:hypothetical protein
MICLGKKIYSPYCFQGICAKASKSQHGQQKGLTCERDVDIKKKRQLKTSSNEIVFMKKIEKAGIYWWYNADIVVRPVM